MWTKTRRKSKMSSYFSYFHLNLHRYLLCVLLAFVITSDFCYEASEVTELIQIDDCTAVGFFGAHKNGCGYCVGGQTTLPEEYGKDCKGECGGTNQIDCNGDCGGSAYIDECTGVCIDGDTKLTETTLQDNKRDCSGACFGTTPFRVANCQQCIIGGQDSPLQDCKGNCYVPSEYLTMAKYVCGQCVGGKTNISISEVQDMCANCKTEGKPCLCNGTERDVCGECDGMNNTCLKIVQFSPTVIPSEAETMVTIKGAFKGKNKVVCVFVPKENEHSQFLVDGKVTEISVICKVKLVPGDYKIGVKISLDIEEEEEFTNDVMKVYDSNSANMMEMSPIEVPYNDPNREIEVNFQGENLPDSPLICIIEGQDWEERTILGEKYKCKLPLPKISQNVTIIPSFDGLNGMKQKFNFSFFSPPPTFAQGTSMSEDRIALIVTFDRPINICDFKQCSDMLSNETIDALGKDAECKWATKQQMVIKLKEPLQGNRFSVTFKPNVIKEDNQKVAKLKNNDLTANVDIKPESSVSSSALFISGPEKVPQSGTFSLIGHFCVSGEASTFNWQVWRSDRQHVRAEISNVVGSTRTSTLTLNVSNLDFDIDYTFELTASSASKKISETKTHTLRKMPYESPVVSVVSDPIPTGSIKIEQEITLIAVVTVPVGISKPDVVRTLWSVNDPRVKFDFKSVSSPRYVIKPNTLPADSIITFTIRAFIGLMVNESSEASITFKTDPILLKASIEGSEERIIGVENGVIQLTVSSKIAVPLVYFWSCVDEQQQPCFDYSTTAKTLLLITRNKRKSPTIQFNSNSLRPGQKLKFGLQVYNASDNNHKSEVAFVKINVMNGSIPEVMLKSVTAAGTLIEKPNSVTGAYFVPAGESVNIHAVLTSGKHSLNSVIWDIIGSCQPFAYKFSEGNSYLSLSKGFLAEHGVYRIEVKACDVKNSCGNAIVSLYATPKVRLCKLTVEAYTAFTWTKATVTGCSISQDWLPLTYQMLICSGSDNIPFTVPEYTDELTFIGPPPTKSANQVTLGVEVCDRLRQCEIFKASPVEVTVPENKQELLQQTEKSAKFVNDAGNPLHAFCMFYPFSLNDNITFNQKQIDGMVNYVTEAISRLPFTKGEVSALYSCITPLFQLKDKAYKVKSFNAIEKSTEKSLALKEIPEISSINRAYGMTADILSDDETDERVLTNSRRAQGVLLKAAAATLTYGNSIKFGSKSKGTPLSMMKYTMLDTTTTLRTKNNEGTVSSAVSFDNAVAKQFNNWECGQQVDCKGAIIGMTLFPQKSPYNKKSDKQLSPVLNLQLLSPGNGKEVKVKNTDGYIKIKLSLMGNRSREKDVVLNCHYWDEENDKWSQEGVQTMGVVSGIMLCWSSHLGTFVVLESDYGLTTATIAGIVVASLMAILIICVVLLFFVRKKQNKEIRVSTEALRNAEG